MEVSSESPRVPPGIGWGFASFLFPRGRAFAIHLCPGVGAFAIDKFERFPNVDYFHIYILFDILH